jgi:hypothetical protein
MTPARMSRPFGLVTDKFVLPSHVPSERSEKNVSVMSVRTLRTLFSHTQKTKNVSKSYQEDFSSFDGSVFKTHCTPPLCIRSKAASMDGQWNNTRRPPSRTKGILPFARQLNSVRRETGIRRNNSRSLMKSGVVFAGAICFSVSFIISICERTMRSR